MEPKDIAEIAKYGTIFTAGALAGAYAGAIKDVASDVARALNARMMRNSSVRRMWESYNDLVCVYYDLRSALDFTKNRPSKSAAKGLELMLTSAENFKDRPDEWHKVTLDYIFSANYVSYVFVKNNGQEIARASTKADSRSKYDRFLRFLAGSRNPAEETTLEYLCFDPEVGPVGMRFEVCRRRSEIDSSKSFISGTRKEIDSNDAATLAEFLDSVPEIPDKKMREDLQMLYGFLRLRREVA